MCHYETYARGGYLPELSLALIDKDLIEAEVVNWTNSRFIKFIFIAKDHFCDRRTLYLNIKVKYIA